MRFSKFLISLALLLSISSISAQTIMSGTWSNPSVYRSSSKYCCIPTTVDVSCSSSTSSSCTATYRYTADLNSKCFDAFLSKTDTKMTIYQNTKTSLTETFTSENLFFAKITLSYVATNSSGNPLLNIFSNSAAEPCDFTMTSRVAPASGGAGGLIIFIIIVLIIIAAGSAKQYQKKQATIIVAQNLAQPVITAQQPAATVQVHGGFVQPQPTYTAPNQFPNTQVNMNFGGNNGGFQAQARF